MMGTINIKSAQHLVDIIFNMDKGMPNYSLLLGAGASWTSGVKTAKEMIETWRFQLYGREKGTIKYGSKWIKRPLWGINPAFLKLEKSSRGSFILLNSESS